MAVPTPPARSAMIANTIMISMSVKPASTVLATRLTHPLALFSFVLMAFSSLDEVLHVENGLKDREHDEDHTQGHADDQQRRQDRGEPADLPLDVPLVGGGHVLEHRLELSGALADGDHVNHQGRELTGPLEWGGD